MKCKLVNMRDSSCQKSILAMDPALSGRDLALRGRFFVIKRPIPFLIINVPNIYEKAFRAKGY